MYKFFEGAASCEEEERIRVWMEESPGNEQTFFSERRLYDEAILLAGPVKTAATKRVPLRRIGVEIAKAAAVLLVVFGAGYILHPKVASGCPISMQTISVPAGQRVNVILPDGTDVWLNSLSTLRYPTSFGDEERRVFLDGEARLEVKRDSGKKFFVTTDKGEIEVLGTSFTVCAYSGCEIFETSLIEGRLNVRGNAEPDRIVQLTPRTKASLVDGKLQVGEITGDSKFDWERGLISFEHKTFAEVMELFERYYGVKISMRNKRIETCTYTGKFRQTDGIDYALRIMQKDIAFVYSRDNEDSVILIE